MYSFTYSNMWNIGEELKLPTENTWREIVWLVLNALNNLKLNPVYQRIKKLISYIFWVTEFNGDSGTAQQTVFNGNNNIDREIRDILSQELFQSHRCYLL